MLPNDAKDYRDRNANPQKSYDQDVRDRDRDGAAGPPGTKDSTRDDPGKEQSASPRPHRSDG